MTYIKRKVKGLGLSLFAALCLMAFLASTAHAITWDTGGSEIKENQPITGRLKEDITLLLPGLNIEVACSSVDVELFSELRASTNDALVYLSYLGCATYSPIGGPQQYKCIPKVLLAKAKVVPFLHNGEVKLLALPQTGETRFLQLDFPETCAFTETNNVTGSIVLECESSWPFIQSCSKSAVYQSFHPVSHLIQLSLYPTDVLKFGAQLAILDGRMEVSLAFSGANFNALI